MIEEQYQFFNLVHVVFEHTLACYKFSEEITSHPLKCATSRFKDTNELKILPAAIDLFPMSSCIAAR